MLTGANAGEAEVPKEGVNLGLSGALTGAPYNSYLAITTFDVVVLPKLSSYESQFNPDNVVTQRIQTHSMGW